jgi:hypothetical protein
MIISFKHKYIFYHVPKTAGSSIKTILIKHKDGERVKGAVHISVEDSFNYLPENILKEFYTFSCVRNPFSRAVSWYYHLKHEAKYGKRREIINEPKDFRDFVLNIDEAYTNRKTARYKIWENQIDYLSFGGELFPKKIIRFENLKSDFDEVCMELFGNRFELVHEKNWGHKGDYRNLYTDDLIEIVAKRYMKDLQYFKYSF